MRHPSLHCRPELAELGVTEAYCTCGEDWAACAVMVDPRDYLSRPSRSGAMLSRPRFVAAGCAVGLACQARPPAQVPAVPVVSAVPSPVASATPTMKPRVPFALFMALLGCAASTVAPPVAVPAPCLGQSSPAASAASAPGSSSALAATPFRALPIAPATFDVPAIDEYLARRVATGGFVGLSVAIVKNGALVLEKGYGHRELPDVPVQTETPFLVGSITKQFVSAVVLQLASEKKLSVDEKVATYYPDLTRAKEITLYDLMTHVSGYRDYYPLDFVDREMTQPITTDEVIARYAKRPLDFEPRTRFSYSSTGYKILGRVIEKITGKPLGVVLRERILRPLGMAHSSYLPPQATPELARGYTSFALGLAEAATPEAQGWLFADSGLYAPAGDIARWDVALMSGRVLGPEAYEVLQRPAGSPTAP
jgi:CubicO group peptidase (beta-lactamase class C family)